MSDVTTGTAFNPQFFMNPPWWIGRVEDKETWNDNIQGETFTNVADIKGWGHRYKVRVFNWHTGDISKLQPDEMAYCQVIMPVTAGSGHGGAAQTPSIESGSIVFGFFMDGMAGQEGYIVGVLGNSNNNVPKERGSAAPNQPTTTVPSTATTDGKPKPVVTPPPTPPTGPGSAANQPVPQNVDQLSADQLKKLLDPSKTPSSAAFRAASEARQRAKASGLSAAEVERQVLIATVKASRQPGASAGENANCNIGYQQFNNTYTDGSEERSAKVPDDRIVGNTPLATTEALHISNKATKHQIKDKKKKIPLSDVAKKNNGDMKGIQRTLKNLINTVEELKKIHNQVSIFATDVTEFSDQVQNEINGAVTQLSGYTKNIMGGVRSYTHSLLSEEVKKTSPNLFPSEVPKFFQKVEEGISLINCVFNKIISALPDLLRQAIIDALDKVINTPLCVAEKMMSNILGSVLKELTSVLDKVFSSINAALGSITGGIGVVGGALGTASAALGSASNALDTFGSGATDASKVTDKVGSVGGGGGNLFNALDYEAGIKKFFSCDEEESPVKYNEISLDGPAIPGGDATPTPSPDGGSPTGTGDPTASSANITNTVSNSKSNTGIDKALADSKANKPIERNSLDLF
jgi:hypothetical protein